MAPASDNDPRVSFASRADWEAWLETEHDAVSGVWMEIAKKGTGVVTVDHPQALQAALCFGWIDGQRRALDDTYFLQRFTPRRSRSRWSKINRDFVEALIASGEMRPAGQAEVDRAKADGRWDAAYDGQAAMQVPPDLQAAFDAAPKAEAFFVTLDSRNRYAVLYRVQDAKRPETRARRIDTFVAMLAAGQTLHPRPGA